MQSLLIRWIVLTVALYGAIYIGQNLGLRMQVTDPLMLVVGAAVLAIVNSVVAPVLKKLACAVNCLTLGLFGVLINVLLFWGVGQLGLGFRVDGFIPALFGSVVTGVLVGILGLLAPDKNGD